jgi:uncharacterized protein DUF6874
MINFTVTKTENKYIHKIAKRAAEMAKAAGITYDLLTTEMDIVACHANGNPLKLDELLHADDSNFGHDVFGIRRHINRDTGKLEDFFSPRFSKPENYIDPESKKS